MIEPSVKSNVIIKIYVDNPKHHISFTDFHRDYQIINVDQKVSLDTIIVFLCSFTI